MSAATLRKAVAVHPIAAMQTEYSPQTRNPEIAVLDACRELGTTFVAFSPVGRGSLCGVLRDPATLPDGDLRKNWPRFVGENWIRNLAQIDAFAGIAERSGVTPAQLALGWVLAKGDHIVTIPGTASIGHLEENIARADWRPDGTTVRAIDTLINQSTVAGPRYPAAAQTTIDTEEFA
jgi:aryl-alcohol dehydrogenase-like predicted oxidoreductase